MAGHSHWARIKRAKAVTDARRGKAWTKLARAIIVAARNGGDPDANMALRYAIDAARAENMPKDTIERAIKKGSGELGTEQFAELLFEGYAAGGAAILATALSDNRNRTGPEIKRIFERRNGNLGASGSVAWMFSSRGVFVIAASQSDEDALTQIALESGADDVKAMGDAFQLTCEPAAFEAVRKALADAKIETESAEIAMVPANSITLTGDNAEKAVRLVEELEEHDDVQKVYTNFEIADDELERLAN